MKELKIKTIGSDPEFFVFDPKGRPYPATLFAKGSKDAPSPIGKEGFFEQRDNLSFEGNVPPATNKEDFVYNISYLREYFEKKVARVGYSLSPNGVEYFDKRYLATPEGMEFGCSKVISAWDSCKTYFSERPTPVLDMVKYRVSGFHLHIGYREPEDTKYSDIFMARLFDLFLTIPSQRIKPEPERIESYGKYGMMRSKSYGVECRTLSSFFTQKIWLPWVWDQVMKIEAFVNMMSDEDLAEVSRNSYFPGEDERYIRRIFASIFDKFDNKEILKEFDETKDIYEDKELKPIPQEKEPVVGATDYFNNPYTWSTTSSTGTW